MGNGFLSAVMSAQESQSVFAGENWKLLRVFNFFRFAIAGAASALVILDLEVPPFGESNPALFGLAALLYLSISLAAYPLLFFRRPTFESLATTLSFADIAFLTFLIHASRGLDSGLGLLLVIAISGASLMLSTRFTVLFAALATIAIGIEVNWDFLTEGPWITERWNTDGYTQMGFLGIGLFITATLSHLLARRLRATEALAQQRGVDLANLGEVNELIIQRLHSGVMVCGIDGAIHMMNKAARIFLGAPADNGNPMALGQCSPELADHLRQWVKSSAATPGPAAIRSRSGYSLMVRMLPVGERRDDNGILLFLEDTAALKQQAQQFKMAALARLTASIAHEIRNPLGAISHAAQLMAENTGADDEDAKLLRIIQEQSRRMNTIIENVTQLARRDRVNPKQLQIKPWIDEFIRQFTLTGKHPPEMFQTLGVVDMPICIDPDQLFQVVGNLCQNALRHSPAYSGEPLIAFKTGHDAEHRPFLDTTDWGSGIPKDIADSIFDPFFTTTPKGTGLGLYIARELCEGNGARIEFFPGEGGIGTRFRVTFARAEDCGEMVTGTV